MLIRASNKFLRLFGYSLRKNAITLPFDISAEKEFLEVYDQCKPYTMTSVERVYSLYQAVKYTLDNQLPGEFVECGVWKGGSSMLIALVLKKYGATDRKIYMYDTFEGMSEPTEADKAVTGETAKQLLDEQDKMKENSIWCYSTLDEVKSNLAKTHFPKENLVFIKGKVEETLPNIKPEKISLLRLDTDWYESTKIELELLYPRLAENGILIIDDFGHWQGAKKAVLEFFERQNNKPFINRIDYSGRLIIKK
jgi:O-methyltransferase